MTPYIASVELLRTISSAETIEKQRATRLANGLMHQDICYIFAYETVSKVNKMKKLKEQAALFTMKRI